MSSLSETHGLVWRRRPPRMPRMREEARQGRLLYKVGLMVRFLFLGRKGTNDILGDKTDPPHVPFTVRKNGRLTYEPSVLYSALEKRRRRTAFLQSAFFCRVSLHGRADTGGGKAVCVCIRSSESRPAVFSSEIEDMRTEPGRIDAILRLPSTSARGSSPRRVRPAAPP